MTIGLEQESNPGSSECEEEALESNVQ